MPARSSGCFQCRKRKVRCDEGRPGCERCAKHGVPCPGYRREKGAFEFEDQTALTAQRAKEAYGGKTALVLKKSSNASSLRSTPEVLPLDLERQAFQSWSLVLPPTMITSPAANKAQLYDKWLEIYVPVTKGHQGLHFDFLRTAIGIAETEPALRDGLNTLALVQVGHAANDERLLAASVPSYGKALASLARAVSKATSVRDDTVLAAANLLVIAEFYDKIKTEGFGWGGHVLGVEQLLLARGPDSLDTDLSLSLFCNARHSSTSWSYLVRKGNPYDTPAWRAVAFRAPITDSSLRLFDASIRVPRLLQRSDELDLDSSNGLDMLTNLLYDCESLEQELRDWLRDFHSTLREQSLQPFTVASVEDFKTFAHYVADRTLPTCYRFNDFMSGYLHSQYWIAMHYLRTTIKDLREQRQSLDPYFQPDYSRAVTDEELSGYTFDLCRSIPHFVEPESGTQGHIGIFLPLAVILMYFKSRQNWKWCLWALNVKDNVFHMGLRQPHVKEKDLPVAVARPRAGLSPFPNYEPTQVELLAPPQVSTMNEFSVSPPSSEETEFLVDDYADVNLNIDWSAQAPGFATAVQGLSEKNAGSDVLELHDDFVYYDTNLSPGDRQLI